jgi:hypothetical protein
MENEMDNKEEESKSLEAQHAVDTNDVEKL